MTMITSRLLVLFILLFSSSFAMAANCPQPGKVRLPLSNPLQTVAILLSVNLDNNGQPDYKTRMDKRILSQLEGKNVAERDASLLALLRWQTKSTLPVFRITMHDAAPLFDTYLDVLERNGLNEAASALRLARAAFPFWNTTSKARYLQWIDRKGRKSPVVDAKLRNASDKFRQSIPSIEAKTLTLAASDTAFSNRLQKLLAATSDEERFSYLAYEIEACIRGSQNPSQALAILPGILRQTVYVHWFISEAGNGSAHQYFFNSTGDDASRFHDALLSLELTKQAADLASAMALLGDPYPTNTSKRRDAIQKLSREQDEALAQPTWIMDTRELYDAMYEAIKAGGFWPE